LTRSKAHWWERDSSPGLVLLAATVLSFALLNSPVAGAFFDLLHVRLLPLGGGDHPFDVLRLINDGLMALFFLYVGLELKRETVEGPFRNRDEAAAPLVAALGGMIAPALIYLAIASDYPRGWAIPAATDIAFAIGALSLLGARVPAALRLFLLALAIIDDVGAILVIAFFYSTQVVGWALGGALAAFGAMLALNRAGVTRLSYYWPLALVLWGFMLVSGVHATIAGVIAAMASPMRDKTGASPLIASEHALKPWVLFGVMPVFALANAGAALSGLDEALAHPVAIGVALGLIVGKPLGVCAGVWLGGRFFKLPAPASPGVLLGLSMFAGIGFTMSLFIGGLAFGEGPLAAPTRIGVLLGSLASAAAGLALLARNLPKHPA
jgi:NhaA family Na+:H+ antiporter